MTDWTPEEAVARAIDAADVGFSMELTRLVDGVATYTFTVKTDPPTVRDFEDRDEGYAWIHDLKSHARARAAIAALDAAAAVRARTEVSDAAFSAGVYAVADALCASQYVNAPDASFVLTLAHHAFAAGTAAQTATSTEAK